ncbi:MAG: hypothetical protein IK140_06465 [Clostridia bacterium]|nr:hypothetical protein [Clostridia bacterium]
MKHASDTVTAVFDESMGARVSPLMFGTNIEHTRSCVYKGLSAQMLRNRKFAGKPTFQSGQAHEWYPVGENPLLLFAEPYTRHHELYHMRRANEMNSQRLVNLHPGSLCGIGQHELCVAKGERYAFRAVAKASQPLTLRVSLTSRSGGTEYASAAIAVSGSDWQTYEAVLACGAADPDADIRIAFTDGAVLTLGAVSLLPEDNFRGMRRDAVEKLRELGVKLIRWPGGNFAGEYNWLDGLLPCDMRAPLASWLGIETQPLTMGFDAHEIGTDDFIALCREVGAEPFITINPCWNTPEENAAWVEYANGDPSTPYGALRAGRGHEEPYKVRLWSLGNEFGYGHMEGENTPEGYRKLARANAEKMLAACPDITLCSSGPYPNESWAKECAGKLSDIVPLVSQHFYAHTPMYASAAELEKDYDACVTSVYELRDQLRQNRSDLPANVRISMDEWNVWYAWNRRSNVTDAVFAALTLHMLLTEADELQIAQTCHFEAVNEGLIEVTPHAARLTAQGRVFALMGGHAGGRVCLKGIETFATDHEGKIFLTHVNPSYAEERTLRVPKTINGCACRVAEVKIYESAEVTPPSDFTVSDVPARLEGSEYVFAAPPHSVLAVTLEKEN